MKDGVKVIPIIYSGIGMVIIGWTTEESTFDSR
jgi:hypothetical protein